MNFILERLTGMHTLTDQVIAMDLLNTAKSGVQNYAMAVTEAVSPEVKATLTRQLEEAIDLHEHMMTYMLDKGLYQPWDVNGQIQADLKQMNAALQVPSP